MKLFTGIKHVAIAVAVVFGVNSSFADTDVVNYGWVPFDSSSEVYTLTLGEEVRIPVSGSTSDAYYDVDRVSGLPSGLEFINDDYCLEDGPCTLGIDEISGAPTKAGTYRVTFYAAEYLGGPTIKQVTRTVTVLPVTKSPTISDLKVTPIEPLGLAIDYTVSGVTANDAGWVVSVTMSDGSTTYVAKTLSGDTSCLNGAHRVYWNVAKDGITLGKADLDVTVAYKYFPLYCVIDLSNGSSATSYPVTYLDAPPSGGFNTTESKTTKLVLKRVDAGSFKMRGTTAVTLTKPFYMGLFEVTQKQWELVMGANPCSSTSYGKGNAYPVHYVSYDMIRGSSKGAKWPAANSVDATSFLGKLRAKTELDFDLPTEAQWEYTCRAGTTTTYSYGDSANGDYMWYKDNSSGSSHVVGTKKANPWGFYDMHGNVWEWCLDWASPQLESNEDPVGSSSGVYRIIDSGSWLGDAYYCESTSSSTGSGSPPDVTHDNCGFRLSRVLP